MFALARDAMKNNPGCEQFASQVTHMLNMKLRPVTAKWHCAKVEGRLDSRDGADEFRGDLKSIQRELRAFAAELHVMAYGTPCPDQETPPVLTKGEIDAEFAALDFGIWPGRDMTAGDARQAGTDAQGEDQASKIRIQDINQSEAKDVALRREKQQIRVKPGENAVGLALSGGGIRSASFGLGVVQVMADKHMLNNVDFLSTVSGGGYTGSFLTRRLGDGSGPDTVGSPHGPDCIVFPDHRRLKARKVRHATHRLRSRYEAYCRGQISFAEFDASVQGWINHAQHANSWGLRRHMLAPFRRCPGPQT